MQASSGWGRSFFKKGPREKLPQKLFSAKLFSCEERVVGGDVCAGEVETFLVVPKILLGNGPVEPETQQNGVGLVGFFPSMILRLKRGVQCTST